MYANLARQVREHTVERARRARWHVLLVAPLIAAVVVAGGLGGPAEGVVSSLGLLYTTLASGEDRILVPNNVVLSSAVVPLPAPSGVDVRALADEVVAALQRVSREAPVAPAARR